MKNNVIGIIGLGQIGGSIALAARSRVIGTVIGFDSDEQAVDHCLRIGAIDRVATVAVMAAECDLIILAVPPEAVGPTALALTPYLRADSVLTDVASTKWPVVQFLLNELPESVRFIPGHPIAGGTRTGPYDADGDIFVRKLVMLTPPLGIERDDPALRRVREFWESLGSVVELMPADFHDQVYAYVSHLPHVIAYAASAILADEPLAQVPTHFFRFIRLGLSGPGLWTDILLQNQQFVLHALRTYIAILQHIRSELEQGPADGTAVPPTAADASPLLATTLFPRIAASALIATVNTLERQSGERLGRYSGAGFADVACPAAEAPEADMELISNHSRHLTPLLVRYEHQLEKVSAALEGGQRGLLLKELQSMHERHRALRERIDAPL